jgi:LPXTG-site transpeptidase (sortase) family protein
VLTRSDGHEAPSLARRLLVVLFGAVGVALMLTGGLRAAGNDEPAPSADVRSTPTSPAPETARTEPVTLIEARVRVADPAKGVPVRVSVPRLRIQAPVIPISPSGGVLVPPSNPHELGWYLSGAQPGAVAGSAVITGHTVHTGGGALDDLANLRDGDAVSVSTGKGVVSYVVTDVAKLSKDEFARRAQGVFSMTVPGRLVLITCTDWNGSVYLSNTVVYADPVAAS